MAIEDDASLTRARIMLRLHGIVRTGPLGPGYWGALAQLTQVIGWPDSGIAVGREALEAWPRCDSATVIAALVKSTGQSAAVVRRRLAAPVGRDST